MMVVTEQAQRTQRSNAYGTAALSNKASGEHGSAAAEVEHSRSEPVKSLAFGQSRGSQGSHNKKTL